LFSRLPKSLTHHFLLPYIIERIPRKTEEQEVREEQEHEQNKSTVNESLFSSPPSQSFYFRHLERKEKKHTHTTTRWNKNQQQRQQILYGFSSSHTAFVLQILFVWLKSFKPGILSQSVRC
jgi:hypothetical protein